jgi:hypothetical protein
MLFTERLREAERQAAESRGENLWSDEASARLRQKVRYAIDDAAGDAATAVLDRTRALLLRAEGLPYLTAPGHNFVYDIELWLPECTTLLYVAAVEAMYRACAEVHSRYSSANQGEFDRRVREIFATERFAFDLIEGQVVPLRSQELHAEVVEPTLRLLAGRVGFESAESAYRDALKSLAAGDAPNAVTDAARALQEVLLALGCVGNALGPLLASAQAKQLLGGHDRPLGEVVLKAANWVSADRSVMGDAHKAQARNRDDAWLTVHIVGALVLRLASGELRAG